MADSLPVGTVTFLFTDIQGSTRLWEEYPEIMQDALARHDALVRQAIERNNGTVFKTAGDSFCAAFPTVLDAITAALTAQLFLQSAPWPEETPIKVRMAIHTGAAEMRDRDYFGPPLNRVARLLSAGHGGQILLSQTAYSLVQDLLPPDITLRDLGEHRLKDLSRPEQTFQLLHPSLLDEFPPLRSLENPNLPNNLPQQTTSFVGREKETAEIRSRIQTQRFVTLTGSGGVGKTRLSLQVAADMLDAFPDGVWFVELASLADPEYVPQTIASVLNVPEESGQTPTFTLLNALKNKHLLLVLDNCEHVLTACAQLVGRILQSCSGVRILASSREALGVAGEQTYRVPSLSLPGRKRSITIDTLTQYEAVRLFIDRAVLIRPDFTVTNLNAPAVASICTRLDGIPLALELAAARVRLLTVEEINTRLTDAFRLLTGGSRTALPRQQTLRAAIDWSYNLLTTQEQRFLARLSVFVGGWTIEAAEAVCSGEATGGDIGVEDWEILDLLTALVDKSLVVADTEGSFAQYRLLETVRQYATEKLLQSGEKDALQTRHRDWYLKFVKEADSHLDGTEASLYLSRLDAEQDDIRVALAWSAHQAEVTRGEEGAQQSLDMVNELMRFWDRRGSFRESRQTLESVLSLPGAERATKARAAVLITVGGMHYRLGNLAQSRAFYQESLALQEQLGNKRGKAAVLGSLGNITMDQREYAAALSYIEAALVINREMGNRRWECYNLMCLGNTLSFTGDLDGATSYLHQSLEIAQEIHDSYGECLALLNLSSNYLSLRNWDAAQEASERALVVSQESGYQGNVANIKLCMSIIAAGRGAFQKSMEDCRQTLRTFFDMDDRAHALTAFEHIAYCLKCLGQYREAAKRYGFAVLQRLHLSLPISDRDLPEYEWTLRLMRSVLGEEAYRAAQVEGESLTWEQAMALALS